MIGPDLEPAPPPPLTFAHPQTPGEVEHGHFDDGAADVQRVPPIMRDDVVIRNLLRTELQYFANDTLIAEFSKMRSLLQEDIQDALLKARGTISGKNTQSLKIARNVSRKVKMESVSDMEGSVMLRSSADPKSGTQDSDRSPAYGAPRSTRFLLKGNDVFDNFEESRPRSTRFLLKGNDVFDNFTDDPCASGVTNPPIASRAATKISMLTQSDGKPRQGSKVTNQELERDLKRMRHLYRRKSRKRTTKFEPTATNLPKVFGENTKRRIARCSEVFFDQGIIVLIVLNGLFIGLQADYQARNLTEVVPPIFSVVEILFCVIFLIELIAKISFFGKQFFIAEGWRWNWFDAILVAVQLIEVGAILFTNHESSSATPVTNVNFLHLVRILRLFRVLRLVRLVEFISELNTIVSSIANSMRSLCWTVFLLLLVMYIVGIMFTQAVSNQRVLKQELDPSFELLTKWWGSLDRSILSLYQAILGGVDWEDVTLPLSNHVSPILTFLFCVYIAFTLLAMLNVIMGIFVESALKNAEKEKETEFTETALALFMLSDFDQHGQITWEEYEMHIDEPRFQFYIKSLGIDPADAKLLFKLLDHDKSGSIDLDELLAGMIRLRAGATFMDVMKIMNEIERSTRGLGFKLGVLSQEKTSVDNLP